MPSDIPPAAICPHRHRRVKRFFIRVLLHALFWDVILRLPGLRLLRRKPIPRWQAMARRYRELAVEFGGVLIKLGQFLSIRVDLFPMEITRELADLQDGVSPEPFDTIRRRMEVDFGRPLDEIFSKIDSRPLGSASLAQVHPATSHCGDRLAVKVLRPNIESIVETDLLALQTVVKWLKCHKAIRKRVNLDWLMDEFATTTRNELNLTAEGKNAERFAAVFNANPKVVVPRIFWEYSAGHTLSLEHIDGIKITDLAAIEDAGICRADVAQTLYDLYMQQVFETYFIHADPHPGNLFVIPLKKRDEAGNDPADPSSGEPSSGPISGKEFQIAFIDFGMMASVPERLRAALREYAIGVGTRDAHRIVQAYIDAGVLLPGADVKRIEEAHEQLFQRFWGVRMADLKATALGEIRYFMKAYRDVIFEAPFQFQADTLFIMRAVGILAGMASCLDPNFDVWSKTIPYAERYAREKLKINLSQWYHMAEQMGQKLLRMPSRLDRALARIERGDPVVQSALSPGASKAIQRLERAITRLVWMVGAMGCLLAATLFAGQKMSPFLSGPLFGASILMFLVSLRKK